jgi:signal transduction histidine kinase
VRSTRLLRSTTFGLALIYIGVFVGSALALLWFVYRSSVNFMEEQAVAATELEINGLLEQHAENGLEDLRRAVRIRAAEDQNLNSYYLLLDPAGFPIAGSRIWFDGGLPPETGFRRTTMPEWSEDGRVTLRPYLLVRRDLPGGGTLVVGHDITEKLHVQRVLLTAISVGGGVLILLGIGGGVALGRSMIRRIERVNRTTVQIMAGDLSRRIPEDGSGDEFDSLAHNLNAMLERIERLLEGMRQVTDNVAHDLRTPLNRIRSRLELALISHSGDSEVREILEQTLKDADGLIATFNGMLSIARIEAGAPQSEWERVDLSELAADVVELYEPLAEEQSIRLQLKAGENVLLTGNRQLIAQALANVVDNAIKYVGKGGRVTVRTLSEDGAVVEVADNGPGIPEDQRERALERFVRLAPERSGPGNGLGLSLVNAVAKLHEAQLTLTDNKPGLRVRLMFPAVPHLAPAGPVEPELAQAAAG